ncbi:unnamed protein product [Adineta ricciae]|uniref:G-protein coupled receptors family 1 profile domain-containing protein n=1 Tax=Adineta ricciae TaxID=249248 RepID=A0A814CU03_ADIRI|nr:unnamed protein product [Adineta ricciae]CAF1604967.1 unnamed protein product [Adineta ricciae]
MENNSFVFNYTFATDECTPWTPTVHLYGHLIPGIILYIFGITFNPIALYYFATSRNFRRSVYSYYFSAIAIFDVLRLNIWFLFLVLDYKVFKFHFHSFECSTQIFSESLASSISAWLTVSLTVERCLVTFKPLQTITDTKGRRALIIILSVILTSCAINSLFLQPGFYRRREYREQMRTVICFYENSSANATAESPARFFLTPEIKRMYTMSIIIFRIAIPFMLLLTTNVLLFLRVRQSEQQSIKSNKILLVRHGQHRQITPMIFFSSCILLLTVSPRYLHMFYMNLFYRSAHCSLTHFAPHLLKTLELCNYAFNVFISIVSGKHGRHELFNMLLCRSKPLPSKSYYSTINQTSILTKLHSQQRSNHKTDEQIHLTDKLSLANANNSHQDSL